MATRTRKHGRYSLTFADPKQHQWHVRMQNDPHPGWIVVADHWEKAMNLVADTLAGRDHGKALTVDMLCFDQSKTMAELI